VPITIIERGKSEGTHTFSISTGKTNDGVAARWWITAAMASPVASAARQLAGDRLDLSAATAAVARSASLATAILAVDDLLDRQEMAGGQKRC